MEWSKAYQCNIQNHQDYLKVDQQIKKQLEQWSHLEIDSTIIEIERLVTEEKLYRLLPKIDALEKYSPDPKGIDFETRTLQKIKSKLGLIYETIIDQTLGQAAELFEDVQETSNQNRLRDLDDLTQLSQKKWDQRVKLALLCRQKGTGMQKEPYSGQIPLRRHFQIAGCIELSKKIIDRKLERGR